MFSGFYRQVKNSNFGRGFEAGFMEQFGFERQAKWLGSGARGYKKLGFLGSGIEGGATKMARLGGIANLALIGYDAYQGYKEGGIWGATKAAGTTAITQGVMTGVFNSVVGGAGSVPLAIAGAAAAGAYGYYKLGEAGQKYAKKLRDLEMGSDVVDTFGTIATMRQRSLNAIQNSRVNGRMAIGNEASMIHRTYMMR